MYSTNWRRQVGNLVCELRFNRKKGDIVSVNIPTKQANDTAKVRCHFIPPISSVTEQTPLATDYYDYSAGDGVNHITANGGEWIADKDGIIYARATGSGADVLRFKIDGVLVANSYLYPTSSSLSFGCVLPIAKGQTIKIENAVSDIACYFYPRKYKSIQPQEFQYSTDEKWVGKYWIDGKKIYAKVLTGTFTAAANSSTDLELVEGVGDVVAVQAFWSTTNGTTTITSGEYHDSLGNRYASNIYKSVGDLWWNTQCPNARNNAPYKVVVEYTKA